MPGPCLCGADDCESCYPHLRYERLAAESEQRAAEADLDDRDDDGTVYEGALL